MSGHMGQLGPPQLNRLYQQTASATEPQQRDRGTPCKDVQGQENSSEHWVPMKKLLSD